MFGITKWHTVCSSHISSDTGLFILEQIFKEKLYTARTYITAHKAMGTCKDLESMKTHIS